MDEQPELRTDDERRARPWPRWVVIGAVVALVAAGVVWFYGSGDGADSERVVLEPETITVDPELVPRKLPEPVGETGASVLRVTGVGGADGTPARASGVKVDDHTVVSTVAPASTWATVSGADNSSVDCGALSVDHGGAHMVRATHAAGRVDERDPAVYADVSIVEVGDDAAFAEVPAASLPARTPIVRIGQVVYLVGHALGVGDGEPPRAPRVYGAVAVSVEGNQAVLVPVADYGLVGGEEEAAALPHVREGGGGAAVVTETGRLLGITGPQRGEAAAELGHRFQLPALDSSRVTEYATASLVTKYEVETLRTLKKKVRAC